MKTSICRSSICFFTFYIVLIVNNLYGQTLTGTYTIPGTINSTTVNNLTQLAALLNAGTVSGTAIFQFTSSYSSSAEAYPITFTQFAGGGNVIIRPSAAVTAPLVTSGSPGATALINLQGVKNISFDGRPGGIGSRIQWAFENTGNGSSYPAFQFINGASSDTLQYLAIQSSCTNTTGTILFSTSTISGGNSNNVIQYDSIGNYSALPYLAIASIGTAGADANAGNTIINNDIYNFQGYYTAMNGAGIYIGSTGNGSNWNISNNSFYATFTLNTGCVIPICFLPGSGSTGNTISGNYIGGKAPQCSGAPWKQYGNECGVSWPPDFIGVYSDAGNVAISGNTVQNLNFGGGSPFYCSPQVMCMYVVGGSASVSNNLVGSDTAANSVLNGYGGLLIGISNSSAGAVTINNNTVANLTQNFSLPAASSVISPVMGIYCYGSQAESSNQLGANTITNNKVFNISTAIGGEETNQYYPILSSGSTYNVDGVYEDNPVAGICLQTTGSAAQTISKNTVYGININTSGGSTSAVMGIVMNAGSGTNIVNANKVYGLWVPDNYGSSGSYSGLVGIYLPTGNAGTYTITNNMIDLGFKSTDSSTVQNVYIFGIWDNNGSNNFGNLNYNIYHNSIYIGGTYNNTYGNDLASYGFARYFNWGSSVYENVKFYNNIIYNNRSGAAPNYGLYAEESSNATLIDWASNYNLVYGTGTGFNFGNSVGTNYATQAAWTTATTMDANTLSSNPQYNETTGLTPDLHVQSTSPINMAGTASFTITYDFDSLIRANYTPVDIGAAVVGSCSPVIPTVTISPSVNNICQGTSVNFTTTETNGGTSASYNFFVDGVSKQNGASTSYSSTTINNGDSVWVVMTSNAACASPTTATSIKAYMVVNPSVTPTVTISPSVNNICQGTNVTFTTGETNGGASPTYNFFVDGVSKQNNATSSYSSTTFNNNDSVWVVMTSNANCASPTTATSAHAKMTVNPVVVPTVTISPSATTICQGTNVNFTTSETNGGATPTYNFFVDGVSKQSGATSTYSSTTLNNNDSIWVVITSDATCASPTTATSTHVEMTVNPVVVPTVTISPSATTICQGTNVTFTTSETNGGATPMYNFFVDGVSKQNTTTSSYSSTTLNNNDSVWVVITSDATCASPTTSTSTHAKMTVNPVVVPTVTISPSTNNICQGANVTFTTSETNGGASPTYTFFVDGVSKLSGATSSYSSTTLNNNDSVWVVMTSNAACPSPATATSTKALMIVNPLLTPTVTISPSANNICQGTSVTFTTSETNGGATPSYDFFVNGVSKQNNATSSYASSSLNNNDSVWVVITSNATCASPTTATTPHVKMIVNSLLVPTVTISPSANNICQGTQVKFATTETNGGTAPMYNFFVDGVSKQDDTTSSYSASGLNNGDSLWVVITSSSTCASPTTATSTHIKMVVNPLVTPTVTISPSVNNVCQGTNVTFSTTETNGGATPAYNFFVNGVSKQSGATNTYSNNALNNDDSVWVVITSNATCPSPVTDTSAHVTMVINVPTTPTVSVSPSANNICQGAKVTFTATGTSAGAAPTYNFFVDGVSKQNTTASTYSNSALNNGDSVWVVMKSNATCITTTNATSTKTLMVVNPLVTPVVSISPDNNDICPGTTVNFSTGTFNGGNTPDFIFYVNGIPAQNGLSGAYTTDSLNNNDSVWVVLISSHACASPDTVTSVGVGMTVIPFVTPSVSISPSAINVCHGSPVNFTTSQTNGGPSPSYNFFVDGISKQNGLASSYSSNTLNNNDSVWVVMTSSSDCPLPPTATSLTATITVNPLVNPVVNISASQNDVCPGTSITFSTSQTNGGTGPVYNFVVNGVSKQDDTSGTYTSSSLNNNDSVWVVMTSDAGCPAKPTDTSSKVYMMVNSVIVPAVSISASENAVCQGSPVTFTASPTGGGLTPQYNFLRNGVSVQNDSSATYASSSINNNDSVWVVMTSGSACAVPDSATSSKVTMTVYQGATSAFSISRCEGVSYFFKGTEIYQTGTYLDTLNTIHGCDSIVTLHYTAIAAITLDVPDTICRGTVYNFHGQMVDSSGKYIDTLTASTGCDSIVVLNMYVPAQPAVTLSGSNILVTGTYHSYQWLLNDTAIQGATGQQYVAQSNGNYKVAVTGIRSCEDTSITVVVRTLGINTLDEDARIDLYPNPTTGELKISLSGLPDGPVVIRLTDVFGRQVVADIHETISGNYNSVMHLDQLPAGVYFISVQTGSENYIRQVEVIK